jgi:6-phosphofructokinase 1
MVVEVMGREAGWIATHAGISGGADAILVPERPFDINGVCAHLRRRHESGRSFSIVVVAEGATPIPGTLHGAEQPVTRAEAVDAFGHARLGGIGVLLEREIEQRTGFEARVTILGHVQRGGTPVAYDRVLATRFGVAAMRALAAGRYGTMVALRGTEIVEVPMAEALADGRDLLRLRRSPGRAARGARYSPRAASSCRR